MKIDKEILDIYGVLPLSSRIPKDNMTVQDALDLLMKDCQRFKEKSDIFVATNNVDIQMDCIDIAITKLNDITQIFRDIVVCIAKKELGYYDKNMSLRACIRAYNSMDICQTDDESKFLDNLLLRNEITHDYFNRDMHYESLIKIMSNYSKGVTDLASNLLLYCNEKDCLDDYLNESSSYREK